MRQPVTRTTGSGTYYHTHNGLEFVPAWSSHIPASYGPPQHVTVARVSVPKALGYLGLALVLGLVIGRWIL